MSLLVLCGCTGAPPPAKFPPLRPDDVAKQVMATLDGDSNGLLTTKELKPVPALVGSASVIDNDGTQGISEAELKARVARYLDSRAALIAVECWVTVKGNPAVGVTVKFEPESFMADMIQPASGVTGNDGAALIVAQGESFGVQPGFYKVRLSWPDESGRERLPEKFNTQTVLGEEVATDAPRMTGPVKYNLP